jgi:hypothetical protein
MCTVIMFFVLAMYFVPLAYMIRIWATSKYDSDDYMTKTDRHFMFATFTITPILNAAVMIVMVITGYKHLK